MDKKIKSILTLITLVALASGYTVFAADYSDMTNHWSKAQVSRWSDYDVIHGSNGLFRPNDFITRGEMAVIMDKVMMYQTKAENIFSDLDNSFYTDSILKANYAGVINGSSGLVRPKDYITREEAAVLMCKAFNIPESTQNNSNFADSSSISTWAKGYVNALSNKKYITGRGGAVNNFDPKGNITRAEAVTIVDNIVKGFYNKSGTYSTNTGGNVVINTPNVVLKDMNISGDLIVAEGVGKGDFTLDGVKVSGSVVLKGGGINSIHFKGNTSASKVELAKTDGDIRIDVSEGANVNTLNIPENAKNVILTGKIENVQSKTSDKLSLVSANISNLSVLGKNSNIDLDKSSKVRTVLLSETASASKLNSQGEIIQLSVNSPQCVITSAQSSKIENLSVHASASNTKMDVSGEIKSADIGSSDTSLKAQKYSNIGNIDMLKTAYNLDVEIMGKLNKVNMASQKSSFTSGSDSEIETITVQEDADSAKFYINGDTLTLDLRASDVNVSVQGTLKKLNVYKTAQNAKIYAEKDCKIEAINTDAKKTEISGKGNVKYVYVNADDSRIDTTNTKIVVASGINGTKANNHNIYGGTSGSINSNGDMFTDDNYYDDMYGQQAPRGFTTVAPTSSLDKNGEIVGTTKEMEYKKVNDTDYITCDAGKTTGLSSGEYYIRYKAKNGYYAGKTTTVTIESYEDWQNSTDANIAIVDKKVNVVRNIDNSNRTIDVVSEATASELLGGIKSSDNSVQRYTLYDSYGDIEIINMFESNLDNKKLRVTSKNGNVSRMYTVRQVAKSSVLDLSLINTNKVTSVDNINHKIKAVADATKSQIETAIRATDRSEQVYTFYKSATSNDIYTGAENINGVRLRVTSEDGKHYRDYIINEPVQKSVSIGAQIGNMTAGTVSESKFNLTTKNISDGQEVKIVETDKNGNTKTNTSGLTITSTKVYNNLATVTVKTSNYLNAGNYYFKVTVDGINSAVATIKVDAPAIVKTVSIGTQTGSLQSGTVGNVKFDIATKNIADNQKVTVFETDSKGNKKTATSGLKFSAENTKSNKSTVTATIDKTVKEGTYYFKVTVDGITSSNVAEIKVGKAIVKQISVSSPKGDLTSGKSGQITFDVITQNIADGQKIKVELINGNNSGISFEATNTKSNAATVTVKIDNTLKAGNYYFKLMVDGIESSTIEFKVNAPEIIKSISIGSQSGKLVSGTQQSATFRVQTENIADGEDVIITETDANGNSKSTSGLTITSTKTSSNKATVTVAIDSTVKFGNYYFKVTCDGIVSNVATVKVDAAIVVKTVSLGTQSGKLESGKTGSATFIVNAQNIADGKDVIVTETDASGNAKNTSALTMTSTKTSNNKATVTVATDGTVKSGNYYLKVTCDGIVSNIATIKVDAPVVVKTVSIGTQIGSLQSGTVGSATFDVFTKNIADGQNVTVFETDSKGNKKTATSGLKFITENIKSNKATVTATIDKTVKEGTYYFKVTVDGITAPNVAEIKVGKAIVKQISVSSQNGKFTSGTAGSTTFDIITQNISDGQQIKVELINGNNPGISFEATNIKSNAATVTVKTDNTVKAGNYYFKINVDGIESSVIEFVIDAPIVVKTISVGSQSGKLESGKSGSATFIITSENIADGEDVIITETDANGNSKSTSGLTMTSTQIMSNRATAIFAINSTVKFGNYYFKVTSDGAVSNIATIRVDESLPAAISNLNIDSSNSITVTTSNTSEKVISKNDFSVKVNGTEVQGFEVSKHNDTTYKITISDSLIGGQKITVSGKNNLSGSAEKIYTVNVSLSVTNVSENGFNLSLNTAVNGITANDIILSPLASITSVTTSDNGKSYSIATKLSPSQYSVTVNKTGYSFSTISFELKDVTTPTVSTPVISSSSTVNAK